MDEAYKQKLSAPIHSTLLYDFVWGDDLTNDILVHPCSLSTGGLAEMSWRLGGPDRVNKYIGDLV